MRQTVVRIERIARPWPQMHSAYSVLACGHDAAADVEAGAEVECQRCDWQTKNVEALRAGIAAGIVTHTRFKPWCRVNLIHAYQRDPESPTGVRLLVSVEESPEVDALLRGMLAPLSPTEGR